MRGFKSALLTLLFVIVVFLLRSNTPVNTTFHVTEEKEKDIAQNKLLTPAAQPLASGSPAATLVPRGSNEKPSFDCSKAKTTAARLICADGELVGLDGELGALFQKLKAQISAADQSRFVAEQRAWIRARHTQCGLDEKKNSAAIGVLASSKQCIVSMTRQRIASLAQFETTTHTAPIQPQPNVGSVNQYPSSALPKPPATSRSQCVNEGKCIAITVQDEEAGYHYGAIVFREPGFEDEQIIQQGLLTRKYVMDHGYRCHSINGFMSIPQAKQTRLWCPEAQYAVVVPIGQTQAIIEVHPPDYELGDELRPALCQLAPGPENPNCGPKRRE